MDSFQEESLDNQYRRMSDASMLSTDSIGSTVSPIGPSTPADSFEGLVTKREYHNDYVMVHGSPGGMETGTYPYASELANQSWHFLASEQSQHNTQDLSLQNVDTSNFCGLGSDDPFRFSGFSADPNQVMDFTPGLVSHQSLADLVAHGLDSFSPHWSPGSAETKSTISPSDTFRVPEVATSFDSVSWDFPSDTACDVQTPSYSIAPSFPTPPLSPPTPTPPRRRSRPSQYEGQLPSRAVKLGGVQKHRAPQQSPRNERPDTHTRFPCLQPMHERAPDGSVRPALDKDGNPKICTKTFRRAEHLTRHKKTDGHDDGNPSDTFCPVPGCKKAKNPFSGRRGDNLMDHYKKTHCRDSEHKGRNRRILREEAARHGEVWLQAWDDAQIGKAKDELKSIWQPHGGADQDPHKVIEFFQKNDLRLKPAELKKALNHQRLEDHILTLLPPLDEPRPVKPGKCRSRLRRGCVS